MPLLPPCTFCKLWWIRSVFYQILPSKLGEPISGQLWVCHFVYVQTHISHLCINTHSITNNTSHTSRQILRSKSTETVPSVQKQLAELYAGTFGDKKQPSLVCCLLHLQFTLLSQKINILLYKSKSKIMVIMVNNWWASVTRKPCPDDLRSLCPTSRLFCRCRNNDTKTSCCLIAQYIIT